MSVSVMDWITESTSISVSISRRLLVNGRSEMVAKGEVVQGDGL